MKDPNIIRDLQVVKETWNMGEIDSYAPTTTETTGFFPVHHPFNFHPIAL